MEQRLMPVFNICKGLFRGLIGSISFEAAPI